MRLLVDTLGMDCSSVFTPAPSSYGYSLSLSLRFLFCFDGSPVFSLVLCVLLMHTGCLWVISLSLYIYISLFVIFFCFDGFPISTLFLCINAYRLLMGDPSLSLLCSLFFEEMLCLCIVLTSKLSYMNNVKANKSAHKESVRDLSFSRMDLKFCSCSKDGTIKVWDFARCQEERSWKLCLAYQDGFGEPIIFCV
ncbi:hypothetical protein AMTRI_Chr03g49290 [Amborella trichopoda]